MNFRRLIIVTCIGISLVLSGCNVDISIDKEKNTESTNNSTQSAPLSTTDEKNQNSKLTKKLSQEELEKWYINLKNTVYSHASGISIPDFNSEGTIDENIKTEYSVMYINSFLATGLRKNLMEIIENKNSVATYKIKKSLIEDASSILFNAKITSPVKVLMDGENEYIEVDSNGDYIYKAGNYGGEGVFFISRIIDAKKNDAGTNFEFIVEEYTVSYNSIFHTENGKEIKIDNSGYDGKTIKTWEKQLLDNTLKLKEKPVKIRTIMVQSNSSNTAGFSIKSIKSELSKK